MPKNYINNPDLTRHLTEWKATVLEARAANLPDPPVTDYIAQAVLLIADRVSRKPNFYQYTYRDEMKGDAALSCIKYVHNFNPEKSSNGFAYLTTLCINSFVRRIKTEQEYSYRKNKLSQQVDIAQSYYTQEHDDRRYQNPALTTVNEDRHEAIAKHELSKAVKKAQVSARTAAKTQLAKEAKQVEKAAQKAALKAEKAAAKAAQPKVKRTYTKRVKEPHGIYFDPEKAQALEDQMQALQDKIQGYQSGTYTRAQRGSTGPVQPARKLDPHEVRAIRTSEDKPAKLAAQYRVSRGLIYAILNGSTYKQVTA